MALEPIDWVSVDHPMLHRLWQVAESPLDEIRAKRSQGIFPEDHFELARAAEYGPDATIESIGLLLVRPLEPSFYFCTPSNALCFAASGGDGVHFSLVLLEDRPIAQSPVVMTIPPVHMHIILGADLNEFLGLGMFRGYFFLEQLYYQLDQTNKSKYTEAYSLHEPWPDDDELMIWLRRHLADAMNLKAWPDVRGRLNQLQREFSRLLKWVDCESGDSGIEF